MFSSFKTEMDELYDPNSEAYNYSFTEVRPRAPSQNAHETAIALEFPVQVSGGKYIDLQKSYFQLDIEVEVIKKKAASTTPFDTVALKDGDEEFGGGQCGLDRAWWANTMSGHLTQTYTC